VKPFGNSVEQKMINAPAWPDAGSVMTCGMVSERLQWSVSCRDLHHVDHCVAEHIASIVIYHQHHDVIVTNKIVNGKLPAFRP